MNLYQKLMWLWRMGVDETIGESPRNRLVNTTLMPQTNELQRPSLLETGFSGCSPQNSQIPSQKTVFSKKPAGRSSSIGPSSAAIQPTFLSPHDNAVYLAVSAANAATSLDQLNQVLSDFTACPLKKTAAHTLFSKGPKQAKIMCIGDVPDAQDDKQGFVYAGPAGELLDKMLGAIGLNTTENAYVSMLIPWRPPGGRKPTPAEIALCLPFIKRHIELIHPSLLVLFGSLTSGAVLGIDSISRARGIWHDYQPESIPSPIPCMVTFSPAFLLNSPAHKKHAWEDLKRLKEKIDSMNLL